MLEPAIDHHKVKHYVSSTVALLAVIKVPSVYIIYIFMIVVG